MSIDKYIFAIILNRMEENEEEEEIRFTHLITNGTNGKYVDTYSCPVKSTDLTFTLLLLTIPFVGNRLFGYYHKEM